MSRFEKLSKQETDVLGQIAINVDGGHNRQVIASLLSKGYIEEYEETLPGWPPVKVKRYSVPIGVHIRWCSWCDENYEGE